VRELSRIDLNVFPDTNRLFLDYVARLSDGIPPFLPPLRSMMEMAKAGAPRSEKDAARSTWKDVVEEMVGTNRRLGVRRDVIAKLESSGSRRARFVVTGQQPGCLGGPLYTAYKVATTVALAARVERDLGEPCVPLFWCGADDADFDEIREIHVITPELSLVTSSIARAAHTPGMPVGDIETRRLAEVWRSIREHVSEHPGAARVAEVMDRSVAGARDHGELSASLLAHLFGGSFAVIDGRSAAVRRHAQPIFESYISEEDEVKNEVTEAGKRLESAGYHAQLAIGADSGIFLVANGRRMSVAADQRRSLEDAVRNDVETCSPGVMARNLVQDYTFEPLATVTGPAEIAYRAQMGSLWQRFGVARPAEFPRMTATFLPAPLAELAGVAGALGVRELVEAPSRFAGELYRTQTPQAFSRSAEEFKRSAVDALDRFSESIRGSFPEKLRGKMLGRTREFRARIEELAGATTEAGRLAALERWPFLSEVAQVIRPADRPQERRVSSLTPFLYSFDEAGKGLIELAAQHVDEVMDGHVKHVVYST
jgi:hypothetical protein